ncbi:Transforming growth factor-beta receptor-associated protein 1 [Armadillidium nasatum]|uniref:Transforming growth factor-beta receptor-associated protein 1 n=1 Tax=Armadillidium nasatum TaxID=96803 RepID=A0A5N5SKC6_9CRUS|nr:Transforming growth factor-beta receptor-associated protein 1 [Armadillidium nasatum]
MSVKAFELILVEKCFPLNKIECIEASGNDLYLGSDDSQIFHFGVEERTDPSTAKSNYSSTLICQRNFGTRKPVINIKAASALGRLLVLSDSNLYLLDADVLTSSSGPKMKNVVTFCINENPNAVDPFTLQFCVGKKKSLQLCTLHEERVTLLKEISTQDPPINMAMDGKFVCVAGHSQYCIYNVDSSFSQDLFPYDSTTTYPLIKRISKEEFLVRGPGNLGMFVTSAGTSERPPIQWSEGVIALSYYHPYIITLTNSFIRIYSLIDQQHKQTLLLSGGILMGNFDGQLYIATDSSLYCLMPQPWTSQVMALLENESIDEAIELTEHSGGAGMSDEKFLAFSQTVFQKSRIYQIFSHDVPGSSRIFYQRQIRRSGKDLLLFLDSGDVVCAFDECVQILQKHQQYAALAKLYKNYGEIEKCIEVLMKLIRGEYKDPNFQGHSQLVEVILKANDESLLWRCADFVLDIDESEGLRMFCDYPSTLDPDKVLKCLARYPKSRIKFLQHLINVQKNEEEKYHTELALYYINDIEKNSEESSVMTEERFNLQNLLISSTKYNPKLVLSKLQDTKLVLETATVYGRMNEHEKALIMLVHELKDFSAAEQYCIRHSENMSREKKSTIYTTLLKIYLKPPPGGSPDAIELAPALDLLSMHSADLQLEEVLQILPADWSVSITHQYLKGALRESLHQKRMKLIKQNLVKCENLQKKFIYQKLCKEMGPIYLTSSSICCVCGKGFTKCDFSLYPNGVLTHPECVKNRSVCPLTGTIFKAQI